jgi:hypothetical protein
MKWKVTLTSLLSPGGGPLGRGTHARTLGMCSDRSQHKFLRNLITVSSGILVITYVAMYVIYVICPCILCTATPLALGETSV